MDKFPKPLKPKWDPVNPFEDSDSSDGSPSRGIGPKRPNLSRGSPELLGQVRVTEEKLDEASKAIKEAKAELDKLKDLIKGGGKKDGKPDAPEFI